MEIDSKLNLKQRVLLLVDKIPLQKATNFGTIARLVGANPRTVGYMLSGMSEAEMQIHPWYRVVAKNGYISSLKLGYKGILQKQILIQEGYVVINDALDMQVYGYYFEDLADQFYSSKMFL